MKSAQIDCGNGWKVIVSVVDGEPFITAQHASEDVGEKGVEFAQWHPYNHLKDG